MAGRFRSAKVALQEMHRARVPPCEGVTHGTWSCDEHKASVHRSLPASQHVQRVHALTVAVSVAQDSLVLSGDKHGQLAVSLRPPSSAIYAFPALALPQQVHLLAWQAHSQPAMPCEATGNLQLLTCFSI